MRHSKESVLNFDGRLPSRGLFGLVPLRYCVFSVVQNFFFFVGPKFFSCVFRGSEVFICGHFVVPKFFLVGFQLLDFQILGFWNFQFFGCMRKGDRKQKYINTSQTKYSISNRFMQLLVLFILERCSAFICANGIFSHLFSSVLHQFTRNSNTWLLQNYVLYFFIDYSNFLIAYSPYSPPGK